MSLSPTKNAISYAFLAVAICALTSATKEVATNSFYVKIHSDPSQPDLAHKIARRNGFHNVGKVLGSHNEYHFVHHGLAHARSKRSVGHLRLLKADPHVAVAVQQTGFLRVKRGFGLPKTGLSAEDLALTAAKKITLGFS
jgi:proprotein convertase subtilisin/kexin type 2